MRRAPSACLVLCSNPRRACAARVLSVKSHLTYGASVRPENAVTYSAGNEGQNICGVFSETAPLQRSSTPSVVRPCVQSAIFPCVLCTRMRISRHAHGACVFLDTRMIYTPPRVQHFSAFHLALLLFPEICSHNYRKPIFWQMHQGIHVYFLLPSPLCTPSHFYRAPSYSLFLYLQPIIIYMYHLSSPLPPSLPCLFLSLPFFMGTHVTYRPYACTCITLRF